MSSSNVDTYQWAMFIQDDFSITNSLTLNAGVRYDYFSIFGSTVNPTIRLNLQSLSKSPR